MTLHDTLIRAILLMVFTQCICSQRIRKNNEPYMYKDFSVGRPITFATEKPTVEALQKKKMLMVVGNAPEDVQINLNQIRRDYPQSVSLLNPTAIEEAENTIEEMIDVMVKTEGPQGAQDDPLMHSLMEVAKEINNTQEVSVRTAVDDDSNASAEGFMDRVKELLAASGVEAILPLDCGRNPLEDVTSAPWIAALGSREDGRFHYRCTGVVISPHHILTDAECVTSPNVNMAQLNVTGLVPEVDAVENFVVGRRIHPSIKSRDDFIMGNNIGVLELAFPLQFNDYVQPMCLPGVFEKESPDQDTVSTIYGFDNINDTPRGRIAGIYSWSSSPTVGAAICYNLIRRFNKQNPNEETLLYTVLTKNHICVDRPFEEVGKSIVARKDPVTGRMRLLGVGPVANARKTNPIAYTLVQPHRFWIELVLRKFRDNIMRNSE